MAEFSLPDASWVGVFSRSTIFVSVHCNQLDDQSWAECHQVSNHSVPRNACSSAVVVARLGLGPSRVAGRVSSELCLNTDWRNENRRKTLEKMRLVTWVSTRSTAESKLGVFEFRLACYQWGNSWCLYSFCLIRRRLGAALFGRAVIGYKCKLARHLNWQ